MNDLYSVTYSKKSKNCIFFTQPIEIENEIIKYERKLNRYEKMHDFLRIVFKNDKDNINFYILNKHFGNKLLKEST